MYVIIINFKRPKILKKSKEGFMGGLGRRTGKGEML